LHQQTTRPRLMSAYECQKNKHNWPKYTTVKPMSYIHPGGVNYWNGSLWTQNGPDGPKSWFSPIQMYVFFQRDWLVLPRWKVTHPLPRVLFKYAIDANIFVRGQRWYFWWHKQRHIIAILYQSWWFFSIACNLVWHITCMPWGQNRLSSDAPIDCVRYHRGWWQPVSETVWRLVTREKQSVPLFLSTRRQDHIRPVQCILVMCMFVIWFLVNLSKGGDNLVRKTVLFGPFSQPKNNAK
jgi:hypothetical protein